MSERTFDRDTLLDLTVNVIPLGIIVFFVVVYAVISPFPADSVVFVIQMAIMVLTGLGLALLTYVSGKAISTSEKQMAEYIPAGYSREDADVARSPGDEDRGESEP
jgi:hypothetical protein